MLTRGREQARWTRPTVDRSKGYAPDLIWTVRADRTALVARGRGPGRRRLAGDGVLELGTTVWGAVGPYAELGVRRTQPGLQGGVSGGHGCSHREGAARPTLACRSSATARCTRNPGRGRGFSPRKQASSEDDGIHKAIQREIDAAVGGSRRRRHSVCGSVQWRGGGVVLVQREATGERLAMERER
jgi:hypothetical protein